MSSVRQVVIIGSGPAGLTAALYAARANLHPLVIEGFEAGGQLMLTSLVENWPGYRNGILGPALMEEMRAQALGFSAEIVQGHVTSVDLSVRPFRILTDESEFLAQSLIVATGASAKWLGLPSERALVGRGVSSCATCDGAFFRDRRVAVVGGGDTAMEEALFLTRFASEVVVVHRRDRLRASKIMQDKARVHPKIRFVYNAVVEEVAGEHAGEVTGIVVRDVLTNERQSIAIDGLFVAIGHTPNTSLLTGQVDMTPGGYIITHAGTRTSVPGVFAAGDVQDHIYRQAITAAGSGCMAAIDAEKFLEGLPQHVGEAAATA